MKGRLFRRLAAFAVILAILGCTGNTSVADAKASVITVKATGVSLREGFILTKKMAKKVAKVKVNGKSVNFSVKRSQIGKKITPSSKGKKKLTLKVNGISKSLSVKVNYMTDLYLKQLKLVLVEDSNFLEKNFRNASTFMASYLL